MEKTLKKMLFISRTFQTFQHFKNFDLDLGKNLLGHKMHLEDMFYLLNL